MTNLNLQLDPVALREATVQAISGILTPEVRAQILQEAIRAVLKPSTNSWEKGVSPLEKAFQDAVEKLAREEAKRYIEESPEVATKLKELLRETADKVLSVNRDKMVERMADAFVSSIKSDRY